MDIRPSAERPQNVVPAQPTDASPSVTNHPPEPSAPQIRGSRSLKLPKHPYHRRSWFWIIALMAVFVITAASVIVWYNLSLRPVGSSTQKIQLIVSSGETSKQIIDRLGRLKLIRSPWAAWVYVELTGTKSKLQAGGYILSPNQSVGDIISHIVAGNTDKQLVTIPPGRTLKELRGDLTQFGYTGSDINEAYAATYDHPLLVDKPASATLEGYIYPETFQVVAGEPLSIMFTRSFDELYRKLQADGMIEKFRARGLSVYQALTLASIVQKEVGNPMLQKQVAQVFYKRLSDGMVLGSDVTFEYAAAQLGVTPAVDIASPYNTRTVPGLPPGPIANMNYSALQAVADPLPGDYVYFVAGDNGNTYFGRTFEEHEANIAKYCHALCNLY